MYQLLKNLDQRHLKEEIKNTNGEVVGIHEGIVNLLLDKERELKLLQNTLFM